MKEKNERFFIGYRSDKKRNYDEQGKWFTILAETENDLVAPAIAKMYNARYNEIGVRCKLEVLSNEELPEKSHY